MQIAYERDTVINRRRDEHSRAQLLQRIRSEFEEMPCLRLTAAQARRLFGLRADISDRVLQALVREGTLTRGGDERYKLRDAAPRGGDRALTGGAPHGGTVGATR
jgi:hypothetical protein